MPATKAVSKKSFSSLKRIKTYLRSKVANDLLNCLISSHIHKPLTDRLDLPEVCASWLKAEKEENQNLTLIVYGTNFCKVSTFSFFFLLQ